jgi:phosphatidylglycerol lysyltransferase
MLRSFGWNATSFQILEPGFRYWFDEVDEGCVAYVDTGRAWVAAGAPVAREGSVVRVADSFVAAARARRRRAVFFATEERFRELSPFSHLLIGEQPAWDPQQWPARLRQSSSLREQLRRARAKGVQVERIEPDAVNDRTAPLRQALEALIAHWRHSKPMPPMGFLVRVDPFQFAEERRLFVARGPLDGAPAGGEILGFAAVAPIYARSGWFVENLIRSPRAPNGTMELLVDAALRDAAALGSEYVTLGLAPLMGGVTRSLHWASRYGSALYDFRGLHAFKAKFRPDTWAPVYLSYPPESSAVAAVYDSLSAFAQRGLLRYGVETLLRGPDIVLRALSLLLLPWSALLASASPRWFPARWMQWSWVAFDLVLAVLLWSLALRFRRWLSALLVGLVLGDALLTSLQALLFNLPRAHGWTDLLGVLTGFAAPVVASLILLNSHRRASFRGTIPPAKTA